MIQNTTLKNKKKLVSNFISLLSMQGVNYILPLLTMPYLFRVLGVEKYGLVAFALSVIMFFNVLVEYGFNLSATREVSTYYNDKQKLIEIYSLILSAKFLLILISLFILTLLIIFIDKFLLEWELFYITFLTIIGNALFPIWFFQGIEEMKYISYLNIFAKLFFTAGIFILIHSPEDYLYQPLLNGLGFIFVGIYAIYFINKKYKIYFVFQPLNKVLKKLKEGWNIFLVEFMPNLYNNFSTFLLGMTSSMESVGYYSLAMNIISVFNRIIYTLRNVTYPYLNKNYEKFMKITKLMIGVGFLLSFIIFTTSYSLMPLIFGEKVYKSIELIYILGISPLLIAVTSSYGVNRLLIKKRDKEMKNITFQFSLLGFILALILIPLYGAVGAAITLLGTRILMSILIFNKGRK